MTKVGEGEEYTLRPADRVVSDPDVIEWRLNVLLTAGFDLGDAQSLAVRADVDVHDVAKWIERGATHAEVKRIVAPLP